MALFKSSNPALDSEVFTRRVNYFRDHEQTTVMTIQGTVNKIAVLLLLVVSAAIITWTMFFQAATLVPTFMMIGGIGGFIVALVTIFKKEYSPVTAPLYAILEGLFLGGVSAYFEAQFSGIVFQAVLLTMGTLLSLLFIYKSGLINVTENFKLGVAAATGGIALVYLISFGMSLFGSTMPYIHESGLIGIGFSLFVVVIAALNLVMDFDFIEQGAEQKAPKYMEWYAAFGLMVTLIWLYIEFLRLLAKLRD
jgi:uncharacterized YccA/Bax inhibitor family protein